MIRYPNFLILPSLFCHEKYGDIHFNFTNGFRVDYSKWMQGNRVVVEGNDSYWVKSKNASNEKADFRDYMEVIYTYAGTLSLSGEMQSIDLSEMQIGDVFIQGGSPGHAVIVVDMAENTKNGEQIFLLAQSYMPAQEIQVLQNPRDKKLSPWYSANIKEQLVTPEWTFDINDLKKFENE